VEILQTFVTFSRYMNFTMLRKQIDGNCNSLKMKASSRVMTTSRYTLSRNNLLRPLYSGAQVSIEINKLK
jgi:hypothetical protein